MTSDDIQRFGPQPAQTFVANLATVRERVAAASARSGCAAPVRVLPVTKSVPARVLRRAWTAGMTHFGESRLAEVREKTTTLNDLPIRWGFVGLVQSSKVKYLVRFASEFHALDSARLADALNQRLDAEGRDLDVFVQVNTSSEPGCAGLNPYALYSFAERLDNFPRLRPRGLMTIPPHGARPKQIRACFKQLRAFRDEVVRINPQLSDLSMGTSRDFEIAIEEGATVVRIGRAIFGPRSGGPHDVRDTLPFPSPDINLPG